MTTAVRRQPFATIPVLLVALGVTVTLLLLAQWHGFHRDELYFIVAGRNLALGYPDQPPLTPLLSVLATNALGLEPFAVRILPALSAGATVVLVAAMARDMGGSGRAQTLGALTIGLSGLLAAGHLGSTATYELLLWTIVMWLVVRLLDGADARVWVAVGIVSGVALQNKQTALILGLGLVGGIALARRGDVLRSPWLWLGGLVAAVVWAPNAAWQAANGFPQLEMARSIASEATENRIMLAPELLLLAGPVLFVVLVAGIWRLLRGPDAQTWRALPIGFGVVVALILLSGGKSYYAAGMFGPFMAAGAIATAAWLERGRGRMRAVALGIAAMISGLLIAVLTLPVLPPPTLAQTPIPELYAESAEQVGWPELVSTVQDAIDTLEPGERAGAIVFTANYGEAGAVELLAHDPPPVYSGHNGYGDWGPPPEASTSTILVGHWDVEAMRWAFGACALSGRVDNHIELDNEEQGAGVWVCRDRTRPWDELWPLLRHLS